MKSKKWFLLIFIIPVSLMAKEKPTWVLNASDLNLPAYERSGKKERGFNPNFHIQFSQNNEIILSFVQKKIQTELATKDDPQKSGASFVALFLSKENGKLIKKFEWPILGETDWWAQSFRGSRIYPMPSGEYVGIINNHLQILDSSLKVIHDRILTPDEKLYVYEITTPLAGSSFVFTQKSSDFETNNEIIDIKTFKTIEKIRMRNLKIQDIWNDQVLAFALSEENEEYLYVLKKKIGEAWNDSRLKMNSRISAKFAYDGSVVIKNHIGSHPANPESKHYWFSIEDGQIGEQTVFHPSENIVALQPAQNAPYVLFEIDKLSDMKKVLDFGSVGWVEIYDLVTRQKLLETDTWKEQIDCSLSIDGRNLVVFLKSKRKIEFYHVPTPEEKPK